MWKVHKVRFGYLSLMFSSISIAIYKEQIFSTLFKGGFLPGWSVSASILLNARVHHLWFLSDGWIRIQRGQGGALPT
jgi:hypothetical protein